MGERRASQTPNEIQEHFIILQNYSMKACRLRNLEGVVLQASVLMLSNNIIDLSCWGQEIFVFPVKPQTKKSKREREGKVDSKEHGQRKAHGQSEFDAVGQNNKVRVLVTSISCTRRSWKYSVLDVAAHFKRSCPATSSPGRTQVQWINNNNNDNQKINDRVAGRTIEAK